MPFIDSARLAIGALTLLATVAVSSAASLSQPARAIAPSGLLMVSGARSAAQLASAAERKLDGALADLTRHSHLARADHQLEDLHAMSPAARFAPGRSGGGAMVAVDAITSGDPRQLEAALVALGMQRAAVYGNDVGGYLPVDQIPAAAAREEVLSLRAAMSRTRAAPVTSEGDFAQGSAAVRSAHAVTGAGITVGILSDSFDCYAYYAAHGFAPGGLTGYAQNGFTATAEQDEADGALPAVNVLQEADCASYGQPLQLPFTDEGRALLQVVHDVAPGAGLAFYAASTSEAAFAYGISQLAAAGARVEADDIGFFDEPFFQDGIVTQAIDTVTAQGVAYFTAAGNNSDLSYENTAPGFPQRATSGPNSGEMLLNFDTSGATTTTSLPVTVASLMNGEFMAIVVEWDQPYATSGQVGYGGGATTQLDVCVSAPAGSEDGLYNVDGTAATCSGANALGTDPVQIIIIANPANSGIARTPAETINLQIGLVSGTKPGRIKVVVDDDGAGSSINQFQTSSPTIQGHANAATAATVAAAFFENTPRCGVSPATAEWYTSTGGEPLLFDANGNPQTAVTRQKPDFTAPDGVNTSFFGWVQGVPNNSSVSECRVNTAYPSFFGTSAATPHAAGVAALMLQYNPTLTPAQILTILRNTAAPMGSTPNYQSGYGFIQADAAFAQVPAPPAGTASLDPPSSSNSGGGAVDAATLAALGALLLLAMLRQRAPANRRGLLQRRQCGKQRGTVG
jgi:hypothetical protein